jgi:hypothetical protein
MAHAREVDDADVGIGLCCCLLESWEEELGELKSFVSLYPQELGCKTGQLKMSCYQGNASISPETRGGKPKEASSPKARSAPIRNRDY